MKDSTHTNPIRICVWLIFAMVLGTTAAESASVGIYVEHFSSMCGPNKFVPPMIAIEVDDFEFPLAALHFSMEFTSGLGEYSEPQHWDHPASGELEDLTIRFEECLDPTALHVIDLFMITYSGEDRQAICIGPPATNPGDPPSITAETCEGELIPLSFTDRYPTEVPDDCVWICKIVPTEAPSWGMLKSSF